jgi:Ca2+-binding RTX toxin-like protein
MATKIENLSPEQQAIAERIIEVGRDIGVTQDLIETAVIFANAESDFNPSATNGINTAYGLFQYVNGTWTSAWSRFQANNASDPLAQLTEAQARTNTDAQIRIMYQDLSRWNDGYDEGLIVRNYRPGGNLYSVTETLADAGIDINNDFLSYAYLRHNTNPVEIIKITEKVFTPANLEAVRSLVEVDSTTTPIDTYSLYPGWQLQNVFSADGTATERLVSDSGQIPFAAKPGESMLYNPNNGVFSIAHSDGSEDYFDPVTNTQVFVSKSGSGIVLYRNTGQTAHFDEAGLIINSDGSFLVFPDNSTQPSFSLFSQSNSFSLSITDPTTTVIRGNDPGQWDGLAVSGPNYSVITDPSTLNFDQFIDGILNNTAAAATTQILTNGLRPGNLNLVDAVVAADLAERFLASPGQANYLIWDPSVKAAALNMIDVNAQMCLPTDPLVLDLNGDGVKLTDWLTDPVLFDADHDGGTKEQTGWVSREDGIVVMDLNGNGKIDNISETLSEYFNGTEGTDGEAGTKPFANGLAALKSLDSNNDDAFTSIDTAWSNVQVWVDADHDGDTDVGELKSLGELGISSISLVGVVQSGLVSGGNEVLATSTFVQGGQTREAIAANFLANPNGQTSLVAGSGVLVTTQGDDVAPETVTYVSESSVGETIDLIQLSADNAVGGSGDDTLVGDSGTNWLVGSQGADSFDAGAGDDVLLIDADDLPQNIHGGAGTDIVQVIGDAGVTLNLALAEVEVVQGGRGDDEFAGGGRSSVFVAAGDGNDIVAGGLANDALSGEDGEDFIEGGAGNDVVRGGRGQDQLMGGLGDDLLYGGLDDDQLVGGIGNDVLRGEQGDDVLGGGGGIDTAEFSGSLADYRITRLSDTSYRVVDTRTGGDGADILTDIERLNFANVSAVDITLDNPMPVTDVLTIADRSGVKLLKVSDILTNDRDWQGDALHITTISDLKGGTVVGTYNATTKEWTPTLTANGEIQFTPNPTYTGVMSFKYKVADADGTPGATAIQFGTSNAAESRGQVFIRTADMPSDELFAEQWYLNEINVLPVWQDYTGKGVTIGQFEPSGPYAGDKEILDYRHPDLQPNIDQAWLADAQNVPGQSFSEHATLVAGVMVAARNGEGAVGVAYGASIAGYQIGDTLSQNSPTNVTLDLANLYKLKDFDISNNSWGLAGNFEFFSTLTPSIAEEFLRPAVLLGRDGLGSNIVMAGGNSRQSGGNTNASELTANRYVITTGAINATGDISTLTIAQAPFSNPGASILVSAPGSNVASTSRILLGDDGTVFGSDNKTAQGTSFATPIVSGVVALMLEANPHLGYRDVQQILALTSRKVDDASTDTVWNGATNWNGGGMHTSHDYGFGEVDARAAVRLAETWTTQHTAYNERHLSNAEGSMGSGSNLNVAITNGGVLTRTLSLGAGLRAEHVEVTLDITHSYLNDLTVELISPTGTVSKLVANPGVTETNPVLNMSQLKFTFDTTHSWGENVQGNWQLRITDRSGLGTGVLNGWKVDAYGSDLNETVDSTNTSSEMPIISAVGNNTYFYTDEFASAPGTTRGTLADSNGGVDILNAAAVSGNSILNLNVNSTNTIAGRNLTVTGELEWAIGGDGNDTITGNSLLNRLIGGRGNDTISAGAGDDIIDGGSGNDILTGSGGKDSFIIRKNAGSTTVVNDFVLTGRERILLVGFENVVDFTQLSVVQEGADSRVLLGDGQSILLKGKMATNVTEQSFSFFSDGDMLEGFLARVGTSATWEGTDSVDSTMVTSPTGSLAAFSLGGDDEIGAINTNDFVDGGDGNDLIFGDYPGYTTAPGQDWLEGGAGIDTLLGGSDNDLLRGGSGDDELYGEDGDDVLSGASGLDHLNGGAGNDLLLMEGDFGTVSGSNFGFYGTRVGGAGADTFRVMSSGGGNTGFSVSGSSFSAYNLIADFDTSQAGEIIDLTALSWIRGFSDLSIQGMSINGTQFARISATNGTDELAITLRGVSASTLTASHFKFLPNPGLILGSVGNNVLTGDAGGNTLDGRAGADAMSGRTGDDTYVVDNAGDTVTELPDGGFDTVQASVDFTLSANVENLVLTGAGAIDGTGNAAANRIVGNSADNTLDGQRGVDTLLGGAGFDTYVIDNQADRVVEYAGEGTDTIVAMVSYSLDQNIENLTLDGSDSINATGNTLANVLTGNAADNVLDGDAGADAMAGSAGHDVYFLDDAGDTVTESVDEGDDSIYSQISVNALSANVENLYGLGNATLTLNGNALDNVIVGNSGNNTLAGGAGNDVLDGGAGADALTGGAGDDTYVVDSAGDVVTESAVEGVDDVIASVGYSLVEQANVENLALVGHAAINGVGNDLDNVISGNSAANILAGGAGDDTLDGGAGNDTLIGGTGNDTYVVDNASDVVTESATGGTDTVQSSATFSLAAIANVENLTLTGVAANATGNALDNVITGNSAGNVLDGGAGNDTLIGGAGNDTYVVDSASDVITENAAEGTDTVQSIHSYSLAAIANVENLTLTGVAANATGNALDNVITGNSAGNVLDGGAGNDTLIGGAGNDTYVVDSASDVVTESTSEGADTVQSSVTFSLAALDNVENLTLTGTGIIDATGNSLSNVLLGNGVTNTLDGGAGDDRLDGGAGNDTLIGGTGNDTYVVDSASDVITENAAEGTDTVQSSVAFSLAALDNVENLMLTGSAAINGTGNGINNVLVGNGAANTLNGGAGNDILDGGAGLDTLVGGAGDDRFIVDSGADIVTENAAEGTDTIEASQTYSLATLVNVENLILAGTAAINGTGNGLDNVITGNGANNTLDGGEGDDTLNGAGGIDTLVGGLGNDTYVAVNGMFPSIVENANEGTDTVLTRMTYSLASLGNVENLTLTGTDTGAINGTGNGLDNVITGNSANNTLDGGAGIDTLSGGLGNDTYVVDTTTDVITENAGEGTDTVQSSITFSLAGMANVEILTLTGTAVIDATGNGLDNVLTGNGVNNTLSGGVGNDTLNGGAGTDTLVGGLGNDTYVVDSTTDAIIENAGEGLDTIQSTVTFTLVPLANVENVILEGTNALNATGNALDNVLIGNFSNNTLSGGGGHDTLEGGGGTDTLVGGQGNDTYVVNTTTDVITENAGEGTDTVLASLTFTLAGMANVENLTLTGTSAINATGNGLGNTLTGNSAGNTLNGGAGADTLIGGQGDDIYMVDNASDVITENAGEGTDTVQASITYSLASFGNVENLTLTGTGGISATGNDLDNVLTGNSGNNTLNGGIGNDTLEGGAGTDTLVGGQGNDTYVVNSTTDVIAENAGGGLDTVQSSVTFTLLSHTNVENLTLTGSTAINATGNGLANTLTGNSGNNTLDGGGGIDTLAGGAGDDIYVVDTTTDMVTENVGEGTDTVQSSVTFSLAAIANVENLTLTGTGVIDATGNGLDNVLTGNGVNNTLSGGAGNDTLNGGAGTDTLVGGLGNDTYVVDTTTDVILENSSGGTDTVQSSVTFTIAAIANVENLTLTGSTAINATGNGLGNVLTGNSGNNTLNGGAGNDTLDGGAGTDTLLGGAGDDLYVMTATTDVITENAGEGTDAVQSSVTFSLAAIANVENLTLTGSTAINATGNSLDNVLTGNSGNNTLNGGIGNDTLEGGAGTDTLVGGVGDDTFVVDSTTDVITENANEGTDTVKSSVTFSLAPAALTNIEKLTLTGTSAINATGNGLANTLTGNNGNNTLDGGAGVDKLLGGLGDDIYVVDTATDVITEGVYEGTDTVQSSVTFSLAAIANVENLTLTGTGVIDATGNGLDNVLTGNGVNNTLSGGAGNDTLNGGAGTDALVGGLGNDTYVVDTATDVITEYAGEGADTVQSSVAFSLALFDHIENLTLTGGGNGTGNGLDNIIIGDANYNTLTGGAGNDTLNGGYGADALIGGLGDDIYVVDYVSESITENANEGTDTVKSEVTFSLASLVNVENLTLTMGMSINATGNNLDNILTGNKGSNTLNGGGGTDTLIGGDGNDTYVVDSTTDVITEYVGEGTDTVQSNITFSLAAIANVENVTLTGTAFIDATGNSLDNVLTGNSGNNTLNGGAGNDTLNGGTGTDTLIGGVGDDIYVVDSADVITENAGEGTDTVQANFTYSLVSRANVENLTLTGTAALSATGNSLDNVLIGNTGYNTLNGGAGNDTLVGGLDSNIDVDTLIGGLGDDTFVVDNGGMTLVEYDDEGTDSVQSSITLSLNNLANVENLTLTGTAAISATGNALNNVLTGNSAANTLTGGSGNDTYVFGRNGGADTVVENDSTSGNTDVALFGADISVEQLWFRHVGNDLEVSIIGTADKLTITNWYSGTANRVEQFRTADDSLLLDGNVENLVQAMAAFNPPEPGQMTLPAEYQSALAPVLAANWQ